jgi:hypothetical protein
MIFVLWFLLLVLQNASFTWVSRARNSSSVLYHAIAAVFSNGIWFVSNAFMIGTLVAMVNDPATSPAKYLGLLGLYVVGTVSGSVLMHWFSMRYLEKGRRVVGAPPEDKK